ncbi:MAG: hypothetical protein ABSH53_18395 [Holophaga sp.]|jgi:hypothetical protein
MTIKFLNPWAQGMEPETLALFRDVSGAFADSISTRARKIDPKRFGKDTPEMEEDMREVYFAAFCRIWVLEDTRAKAISLTTLMKHLRAVNEYALNQAQAQTTLTKAS